MYKNKIDLIISNFNANPAAQELETVSPSVEDSRHRLEGKVNLMLRTQEDLDKVLQILANETAEICRMQTKQNQQLDEYNQQLETRRKAFNQTSAESVKRLSEELTALKSAINKLNGETRRHKDYLAKAFVYGVIAVIVCLAIIFAKIYSIAGTGNAPAAGGKVTQTK